MYAMSIRLERSLPDRNRLRSPLSSPRNVLDADPLGPLRMNDTTPDTPDSGPDNDEKGGESRRSRSIRFSDPEWETVEIAAAERGMNAAEFARHATLGVASGRYGAEQGALPPQFGELIEFIFRSSHIMVSLKREEMIREGREDELDRLIRDTRAFQDSLLEGSEG